MDKLESLQKERKKRKWRNNKDIGAASPDVLADTPVIKYDTIGEDSINSSENETRERNADVDTYSKYEKKKKKKMKKKIEKQKRERGMDKLESPQKERKKKKRRDNMDVEATSPKVMAGTPGSEYDTVGGDSINSAENEPGERNTDVDTLNTDEKKKKKIKKWKREQGMDKDGEGTNPLEQSTPKGTSKRVSFSEEVKVFPSSDGPTDEGTAQDEELVRGKRFSLEEDEMIKEAVWNYINNRGLGEEGLKMVLQCKQHPEVKNCWKEIGADLPWRPVDSVYYRAHNLFERAEQRSWCEEELEIVRKFHEKYGADWRTLGDALGKHRFHVKDAWRRIKLANRNRGKWSQEEYQTLFDLVNLDLRMKALEETKSSSKHGMLRDNICWTAISEKLGTRTTPVCCMKWYDQLASPMVAEGKWLDIDDYHLLIALYNLDACCMEDVDWDSLLEHRPGDICRKRWNQMARHLGEHGNKSFADQVEVLIGRYCPDVLEAREAYDSKPLAP